MQNLAPLLAVLIAGALLGLASRSRAGAELGRGGSGRSRGSGRSDREEGPASGRAPLVRLSATGGKSDERRRWSALRLIVVGALFGLGMMIVLPWIAASGAPSCVIARAGESCVDGEPLSPAPWLLLACAGPPLLLLIAGDLRRLP